MGIGLRRANFFENEAFFICAFYNYADAQQSSHQRECASLSVREILCATSVQFANVHLMRPFGSPSIKKRLMDSLLLPHIFLFVQIFPFCATRNNGPVIDAKLSPATLFSGSICDRLLCFLLLHIIQRLPIERNLDLSPHWHIFIHQRYKPLVVMPLNEVDEFVQNDILEALGRFLGKL